MKVFSYFGLLIILFSNCNSDEKLLDAISENRIKSINFERESDVNTKTWTENFVYNDIDQLIRLENLSEDRLVELEYDNAGRVIRHLTYSNDDLDLIFVDSMIYNQENQMVELIRQTYDADNNISSERKNNFEYNGRGQVVRKRRYFAFLDEETFTHYFWEDGNIIRKVVITNDVLGYEYIYEYDNKANYLKDNSFYFLNPLNHTLNNVVKTRAKMNSSNSIIDFKCNPCKTKYNYNVQDLPNKVKLEWRETRFIDYF